MIILLNDEELGPRFSTKHASQTFGGNKPALNVDLLQNSLYNHFVNSSSRNLLNSNCCKVGQ